MWIKTFRIPERFFISIKPRATILISGNGFSKTFYSDTIYDGQLNLKPNATYNFVLTGSDAGGIRSLEMQTPSGSDIMTFAGLHGTPAFIESISGLSKFYRITGVASDPYTSFALTGTFTTADVSPNTGIGFGLSAYVYDYGNLHSGINVPCYLSVNQSNIYGWIPF